MFSFIAEPDSLRHLGSDVFSTFFTDKHNYLHFCSSFHVFGKSIHDLTVEAVRVMVGVVMMHLSLHPDSTLAHDILQWATQSLRGREINWPNAIDTQQNVTKCIKAFKSACVSSVFEKVIKNVDAMLRLWFIASKCLLQVASVPDEHGVHALFPIPDDLSAQAPDYRGWASELPKRLFKFSCTPSMIEAGYNMMYTACSAVLQYTKWNKADSRFISLVSQHRLRASAWFAAVSCLVLRAACPADHLIIPTPGGFSVWEVFGPLGHEAEQALETFKQRLG